MNDDTEDIDEAKRHTGGGDALEAIRRLNAVDLTGQQTQAPIDHTKAELAPLPPNKRFDAFTQSLAGVLIAQEETIKRAREDIHAQLIAAEQAHDEAVSDAARVHQEAVERASAAFTEKRDALRDQDDDATKASEGIAAALQRLT